MKRTKAIAWAAILLAGCAGRAKIDGTKPPPAPPVEAFTGDEPFAAKGGSSRLESSGVALTVEAVSAMSGTGRADVFLRLKAENVIAVEATFDPSALVVSAAGSPMSPGNNVATGPGQLNFKLLQATVLPPGETVTGVVWFSAPRDQAVEPVDVAFGDASIRFEVARDALADSDSKVFPESEGTLTPRAIAQPQPVYPIAARSNNRQGKAVVEIVVDRLGHVARMKFLEGDEIFRKPAETALAQWRYEPVRISGVPIWWKSKIILDFKLTDDPARSTVTGATPKALHTPKPTYPPEARAKKISGTVIAEITVNRDGHVTRVKVLSGDKVFAKATRETLLTWRYEPIVQSKSVSWTANVTLRFALPADGPAVDAPASGDPAIDWGDGP